MRTRLRDLALASSRNRAILARLPDLGVADAWLVAGCVYDAVWNAHMGWPADADVNDYDIFYFEGGDLSYAAEDVVIRRGRALFDDLGAPVEAATRRVCISSTRRAPARHARRFHPALRRLAGFWSIRPASACGRPSAAMSLFTRRLASPIPSPEFVA